MKKYYFKGVITMLFVMLCLAVSAQNVKMSVQGILKNFDGSIVPDNNYNVEFRIYNATTGGTALWTETQAVSVMGGVYNAVLGSTALGLTDLQLLPFDVPYYLGITVQGSLEMTPRIELTGSATTIRANKASLADVATLAIDATHAHQSDSSEYSTRALVANGVEFAEGTMLASDPATGDLVLGAASASDYVRIETGALKLATGLWHQSSDGKNRFNFDNGGATHFGSQGGYTFRNSLDADIFVMNNWGKLMLAKNEWHISSDNKNRFLFQDNGTTYFGTGSDYEFRSNSDAPIFKINDVGAFKLQVNTWHQDIDGYNRFCFNPSGGATYFGSPNGYYFTNSVGNNLLTIGNDGNGWLQGSLAQNSDRRLKTNINPLRNSLSNVMQLQGVTYYWNQEKFPERNFSDKLQIGVIAQDIEKIYPELVNTDDKGFKSVNYTLLTPVLIEAIKELKGIIDNQNTEIEKLKADNSSLKTTTTNYEIRLKKIEEAFQLTGKK